MSEIYVTEHDEADLSARNQATRLAILKQRRKEALQCVFTALIGVFIILAILAVIALLPIGNTSVQIVAYQLPAEETDPPLAAKKVSKTSKPKPPGASASMAKVLATDVVSPVAVPIPEITVPDATFGLEEDFGVGFGLGDGDGDGGGGANFFGTRRKGRNVVFCVDFSGSMDSDAEGGGGTRIQALKKELVRSIKELPGGMNVTVIFFSTTAWTADINDPEPHHKGWKGNGKPPEVNWYPATSRQKDSLIQSVKRMPAKGGTNWYPPLKMAFTMSPRPDIVYLLSDGQPTDGDEVVLEMDEINPDRVPIDTIAFELPGSPAAQLLEIAEETGGKFTMIHKGKTLRGRGAKRMTDSSFD